MSQYEKAGVDYSVLDRVKRAAVERAAATAGLLGASGGREFTASRGATAYVFEVGGLTLATVTEGLGTKSVIAEQYLQVSGESRFADLAVDAVASIVNDVVSVGANPLVVTAYFATGDAAWYNDERKSLELLAGWQRACEQSGATWGGGESPALPGLLTGAGIELGGNALALVPPGRRPVLGNEVRPGDRIVVLPSSGLHTNGASLARRVADGLSEGLLTPLPSGRALGAALLDPSVLYPAFVRALLDSPVEPHFLNPITGHGLLKMMRPAADVRYVLDVLPDVPEVLGFLASSSGMSPAEAYATFNMGFGYVAVVAAADADRTVDIARAAGYEAFVAGEVVAGDKSVSVPSLGIAYGGEELRIS
ncbi:phosphoribosylformylglycinamidine cyclo-ligase [Streptomyces sp. 2131.1]|uniref:AIR synthase-related protein n=1 Tax=Streptomyces sp. 2131.1 TaxID=1855346 RepID=UPI00089845AF|nr:AIR synthase-related protein [Streptomyces sp. 2131.1]SEE29555.1 phosphoribosylformylglycinamidine cyclo-ligase [Streptomyces sp. 2131.1]